MFSGAVNITNTIIAGNTTAFTAPDLAGAFASQGFNLIGNGTGSTGFTDGVNGDQVGVGRSMGPSGHRPGGDSTGYQHLLPGWSAPPRPGQAILPGETGIAFRGFFPFAESAPTAGGTSVID